MMTTRVDNSARPDEPLRFLDDLLVRHPTLHRAIAEFARYTGRTVAIKVVGTRVIVVDPDGVTAQGWPSGPAASGTFRDVTVALGGPRTPRDAALLERLAVLTIVLRDRETLVAPQQSRAAMVAQLMDPTTNSALRNQILIGLGLRASTPVRAFTVAGADSIIDAFARILSPDRRCILPATRSRTTLLLRIGDQEDLDRIPVPRGLQVGASRVHRAGAAPSACMEADNAFRFSQPSPRDCGPYRIEEGVLVPAEGLSGYEALAAALTPEQISRIDDVQAVDQILMLGGQEMLATLDAVAVGSIRYAARALHVHHNSVRSRVAQAERLLGFELSDAYGRNRLFLALTLRRIQKTHGMVG
ncbi:helix-turn-helix domain-containing protein [Pseudonocardia sp. RS010]|uniref:helix-turn-helix domain-containing protein n=1 Tax=Pseudonocardia sp. RS010 TaxID=3385979 RepID=UPI00399FCD5B